MNTALKNKERIILWLGKYPGSKSTEIGKALDMSRVAVYLHLQTLVKESRVEQRGSSRATRYFPMQRGLVTRDILPEIRAALFEKYEEPVTEDQIRNIFGQYTLYIDQQNMIHYGVDAFVLWCHDPLHNFSASIPEKAVEYLDLIGSIEYLRGKNGFLDVTTPAQTIMKGSMDIGFEKFFISMVSVLSHGFGSTRTALSLRYGKKNGNSELLRDALSASVAPIQNYIEKQLVDAVIYAPPTEGRRVQFRDILEEELSLNIEKIQAEKLPLSGRILEPQKSIRDKKKRIHNALESMTLTIPKHIHTLTHILILDDSFTTGATPNAIALKLRDAGYAGKITIITICGSFDYELAISEDEI